jgi:hypothetical protein
VVCYGKSKLLAYWTAKLGNDGAWWTVLKPYNSLGLLLTFGACLTFVWPEIEEMEAACCRGLTMLL